MDNKSSSMKEYMIFSMNGEIWYYIVLLEAREMAR